MSSLGLPTLAHVVRRQEAKTHVEEWLRGAQRVPVVEGGAETAELMVGNYGSVSENYDKKYDDKYDKYDEVVLSDLAAKGEWGMCNSPRAHIPRVTISSRARSNDTRTPRIRGSVGRRLCQALPTQVAKGRAMGTDWSLRHEAFVCSGPDTGAAMRTS